MNVRTFRLHVTKAKFGACWTMSCIGRKTPWTCLGRGDFRLSNSGVEAGEPYVNSSLGLSGQWPASPCLELLSRSARLLRMS